MGSGSSSNATKTGPSSTKQKAVVFKNTVKAVQAFTDTQKREKMPWKTILDHVANTELWEGDKREERSQWREYLDTADELVRRPRKSISKDVVKAILEGDTTEIDISDVPNAQPKVVVFVSSTFTDTKAERNHLMKDVYPYLRTVCGRLGIEFGTVDMRWGVTEEATMDHSTVDMCVNEIQRCIKDSVGPAFLCFLGHKYGYRPLPAQILQTEYETLRNHLTSTSHDLTLLDAYYRLDTNAVPPEYWLIPKLKENASWWDDVEKIQEQFREAAVACFGESDKRCDKYHISVTETEIYNGAFDNPNLKDQATFIRRSLDEAESDYHKNRKLIDMQGTAIDSYAQSKLEELKGDKLNAATSDEIVLDVQYTEPFIDQGCEYIRRVCDHVCKTLTENILDSYQKRLHVEEDSDFQEALHHRNHAKEKASIFVGRVEELKRIQNYVTSKENTPLVIHGQSGCGKTALMAVTSLRMKTFVKDSVVVLRFLGTSGQSGAARSLLLSLCTQIRRIYGQYLSVIPSSYKDLIKHFRECMLFAKPNKPLIIILDSLDQLSNEDFAQNLAWLSLGDELPENVKLILSTLPTKCLTLLKSNLSDSKSFVEVLPLRPHEGPEIMTKMLEMKKRKVTDAQKELIIDAFEKCPLPLFLRLVVDIAESWHSYDDITSAQIADDIPGLITLILSQLESRYGEIFVHHALSYITASKSGLSLAELEDILSCDDDVLDSVFQWWIPPVRRIPPLLWARVRNELGMYLAERGTDGVSAYGWYHRQFWETAEKRYLNEKFGKEPTLFLEKAHVAIADYFDGKWIKGKPHVPKGKKTSQLADRKLQSQSIVISGQRRTGRKLNKRKLAELPHHLIELKDWERFKRIVINLEYTEAKFEAGVGYNCLAELIDATKASGLDVIKDMTRFVGSNISFLLREPTGVYQMALQQSANSSIRQLLEAKDRNSLPLPLMTNMYETDTNDPCEMTLQGHTSSVRCCDYSPKGDLLISSSDDLTMRIWDTTTGAELVTITSLPKVVAPTSADPSNLNLHPINPCSFSRDGERIASGNEEGGVSLWDVYGVQLHTASTENKPVTFIRYSPDNKNIATCYKNSVVDIWAADDLKHVTTVNVDWGQLQCLDFSKNGKLLAVMSVNGLVLIDVANNYQIQTRTPGQSGLNLCCRYHPSGKSIMSGGDDSCVSVWGGNDGKFITSMRQHTAWIWNVQFSADGKHMFTCSSDRSMKVWKFTNQWIVIATVGGHSHRVCMASIQPGSEAKLVTSSLDSSLKVWNMNSLLLGQIPPVGTGHFNCCSTSPSGEYLATSQGWHKYCNVYSARANTLIGATVMHHGFIKRAYFTSDETKLVMLDHGHGGDYPSNAEANARVKIVAIPSLNHIADLDVPSPTAIAVNSSIILVGTGNGDLHLINSQDHAILSKWNFGDPGGYITEVSCCNGSRLIAACCKKTCKIWEASEDFGSCSLVKDLGEQDSSIQICKFSPDGKYLVIGLDNGSLHIWVTSDKNVRSYGIKTVHTNYIKNIKFSSNGLYMVTSADLTMRIWDVKAGFSQKCTYYAPVNCAGLLSDDVIVAGEATGNKTYLKF